ncbi:MAG: hypothetical protein HN653_01800 [Candidatus Marinimicrobia bacterium]|nr:hypothetical protein [Candidatus Neomarinimicrobiota bacterium]
MKKIAYLYFLLSLGLFAQKRDPRSVAMAGATSTSADGIYAVGFNPGLIAFQKEKPFMLQLGGLDFGISNNYLSMAAMNTLSGDTLDSDEKSAIINRFQSRGGLTFDLNGQVATPGINYASGNMALTSNILYMSSYALPAGMARLMLEGNANNPDVDMTLGFEIMGVHELGFSFAVPFESYAVGFTLKYLQGLFYMGIDPDSSSANLITTPSAVYGSGSYYLRQGFGGAGYGLDIGIATKEFNGYRFGVSLINAVGSIGWNKPSFIKDIIDYPLKWDGEQLSDSVAVLYTYKIDSLRADNLSSGTIFTSSSKVVKNLDEDGKVKQFDIRYPAILRLGLSYKKDDLLISSDLTTGFENRLYANSRWRWAIGVELYRFPTMPLRMGFAWEGMDRTELGLGAGFHGGPVMIDFGFSFRNGMWIHSMKGLNLSLGFTMTSFKGRKDNKDDLKNGPSPIPQESLSGKDKK